MNETDGFTSPACYAHGIDEAYMQLHSRDGIARWRAGERRRLLAARLAVPVRERARLAAELAMALDTLIEFGADTVVSAYWPVRGEPDLRPWLAAVVRRGARVALPVVLARGEPLVFREWAPGTPMARGVWNIPIPAGGVELLPTVIIAPLVGYDAACFRLGYGGGYFDRTLAASDSHGLVIGVGHAGCFLPTIRPQPHDIPMDVIITGKDRVQRRCRSE